MPVSSERTALYRYFDADDGLLYIGISNDPAFRWKAHRYGSGRNIWPTEAVRRTIEWHDSRPLSLKAEETAIKAERPRYNEKHNYDDAPFDPSTWPIAKRGHKVDHIAELIREEITSSRWGVGQRIPPVRVMAEATGAKQSVITKASAKLQREGVLALKPGRGLFVADSRTSRGGFSVLPHDWPQRHGFPG